MVVIARVTGAVVLWLIAFVVADLQMPVNEDDTEDVTVDAVVDLPANGSRGVQDVTITNQRSRPVLLAPAAATLRDATPACSASLVKRAAPEDAVEVPPGATVVVPVHVRLDRDTPATCRTETWPVELAATAPEVEDAAASPGDGPGLLRYVIATTGVLALGGLTLLTAGAIRRWRRPVEEPRRSVTAGRSASTSHTGHRPLG